MIVCERCGQEWRAEDNWPREHQIADGRRCSRDGGLNGWVLVAWALALLLTLRCEGLI